VSDRLIDSQRSVNIAIRHVLAVKLIDVVPATEAAQLSAQSCYDVMIESSPRDYVLFRVLYGFHFALAAL